MKIDLSLYELVFLNRILEQISHSSAPPSNENLRPETTAGLPFKTLNISPQTASSIVEKIDRAIRKFHGEPDL